jgi:hypothetical protein
VEAAVSKVKDTLDIEIKLFSGQEEGADDVGYPYYVATCTPVGLVTYGETFEILLSNIQEGLAAAMEGEDTIALYYVAPSPRIVLHI